MLRLTVLLAMIPEHAALVAPKLAERVSNVIVMSSQEDIHRHFDAAVIEDHFGGNGTGVALLREIRAVRGNSVRIFMLVQRGTEIYYEIFQNHYLNEQIAERADEVITLPLSINDICSVLERFQHDLGLTDIETRQP